MPGRRSRRTGRSERGASLLELLFVLSLIGGVTIRAWQVLLDVADERAGREAARSLAADLRALAVEARAAGRTLAVEFAVDALRWRVIADANGNGVTAADIASGIDVPRPWQPVFREGQARLAIACDVPDAEGTATLPAGSPPVRLGAAPRITFTPRGTATAASLYVASRHDRMFAVRVLGSTQRTRVLCLTRNGWEVC